MKRAKNRRRQQQQSFQLVATFDSVFSAAVAAVHRDIRFNNFKNIKQNDLIYFFYCRILCVDCWVLCSELRISLPFAQQITRRNICIFYWHSPESEERTREVKGSQHKATINESKSEVAKRKKMMRKMSRPDQRTLELERRRTKRRNECFVRIIAKFSSGALFTLRTPPVVVVASSTPRQREVFGARFFSVALVLLQINVNNCKVKMNNQRYSFDLFVICWFLVRWCRLLLLCIVRNVRCVRIVSLVSLSRSFYLLQFICFARVTNGAQINNGVKSIDMPKQKQRNSFGRSAVDSRESNVRKC